MTSLTPILPAAGEAQLIPAYHGSIGGVPMQVCKAKDLHAFLEVGRDFSNWFRGRVEQYGFVQDQDFASFRQNGGKPSGPKGGRPSKDYLMSLDMAKELSMVENNDRGRDARRYFIAVERKALGLGPVPATTPPAKLRTTTFDKFFAGFFEGAAPAVPAEPLKTLGLARYAELVDAENTLLKQRLLAEQSRTAAPEPVAVTTPNPRRASPEEEAYALERYTAGDSKYAIAKALGRHGKTIDRILARANRAEPGTDDLFAEVQS